MLCGLAAEGNETFANGLSFSYTAFHISIGCWVMDYSKQYNDALAAVYAEQASMRADDDLGRAFLRRQLSPKNGEDILVDVGCGSGIDLLAYIHMGFRNIFGIDSSLPSIENAKLSIGEKAKLLCGKFKQLPFKNHSVDVVTSRFSLMYCNNIEKVFAEAARILKPEGLFAAVVSHPLRDARLPQNPDGTITVTFFNGAVTTTYPRHTRDDYIGPTFLKYFEKTSREEFSDKASARYVNKEIVNAPIEEPTVLCFSGTKRRLDVNVLE